MNPQSSRYYTYIKPVFKNPFVRTYSSLVFSLIAVIFFGLFAIRPTIKTILTLQTSLDEHRKILNDLTEKSANLEKGRRNYNTLDDATKDKLEQTLPTNPALASLIEELASIGLKNQASISGLQFQPLEINNVSQTTLRTFSLKEIVFTFNARGEYQNLLRIIDNLGQSDRLIEIDSIHFHKPNEGSITMSINGRAYFLR